MSGGAASGRGRALTSEERAALGSLCECVDTDRVRLHDAAPDALRRWVLALSGGRAVALGNHVFLPGDRAGDIPLLAHELTHCGQYQAWGGLAYFARGINEQVRDMLSRLGIGDSPYRWRPAGGRPFDSYGMEQQGQIVEDCYRGDPEAAAVSPYRPATTRDTASMNASTSSVVVSNDAIQRTSGRSGSHS